MANWINIINFPIFGIPFCVFFVFLSCVYIALYLIFVKRKSNQKQKKVNVSKDQKISKFSAFATSASGTAGIGNILGGTLAVTVAGPGSLIWIIILGFLVSVVKFTEVYLACKYKIINNGQITGGSFVYIKKLLNPKIAVFVCTLYSLFFILAYLGAGSIQLNQINSILDISMNSVKHKEYVVYFIIFIITTITAMSLFGGIKTIARILGKVLPIMFVIYILLSLYLCYYFNEHLVTALSDVFTSAFTFNAGLFGVIAYAIQRICLATDAGSGSSAISNSKADATPLDQAKIVLFEPVLVSFGMFLTGFVIYLVQKSGTAFDYNTLSGVQIVYKAFSFNILTKILFLAVIILFGTTTFMAHGYNTEQTVINLCGEKYKTIWRIFYITFGLIVINLHLNTFLPVLDFVLFVAIFINVCVMICGMKYVKE